MDNKLARAVFGSEIERCWFKMANVILDILSGVLLDELWCIEIQSPSFYKWPWILNWSKWILVPDIPTQFFLINLIVFLWSTFKMKIQSFNSHRGETVHDVLLYSKCIVVFPCYHEFKLIFLENHTEFWIRVKKKLYEPIVLTRKGDGLLLFLKFFEIILCQWRCVISRWKEEDVQVEFFNNSKSSRIIAKSSVR